MLSVFATRSTIEFFLKLSYCKPVKIKFWHLTLVKVGPESLLEKVEVSSHESSMNLWASDARQNLT